MAALLLPAAPVNRLAPAVVPVLAPRARQVAPALRRAAAQVTLAQAGAAVQRMAAARVTLAQAAARAPAVARAPVVAPGRVA